MTFASLVWSDNYSCGPRNHLGEGSASALADFSIEKEWRKVRDQIILFSQYGNNWDGFDSEAPRRTTVNLALTFLETVRLRKLDAPARAALSPDGEIAIEWRSDGICRQVEIGNGPEIEWVEFGPGRQPVHWSEHVGRNFSSGGRFWNGERPIDQDAVVSASAL